HFSGIQVTSNLKRPTRRPRPGQPVAGFPKKARRCLPIWPCIGRRLPCRGCHHHRGGLFPPRFTLTSAKATRSKSRRLGHRRSVLCGAGVGLLRLGVTQRPAHEVRTFLSERYHSKRSPSLLPRARIL